MRSGSFSFTGVVRREDMEVEFLVRGMIIGFSIAAPIGPIGMLCIRRTLAEGRATGLAVGLGAASADSIYASMAGFGLTLVSAFLVSQQVWLRLIGGGFLCYLGVKIFLETPAMKAANVGGKGLLGAYTSTFFLTLTNPATIISFTAVFAGLGVASVGGDYLGASALVVGVFLGSLLWTVILTSAVTMLRGRFTTRGMRWVNRLSGATLMSFGIAAIVSLAF
jgi:threonine/homoserine/homoserine lactone efflux protein